MMSKIIKAAQLKINQIDEEPRLGLALIGKSLVTQYRGPQNFSQAEVRATYLSREISLSVIKRVPNWLGATLSSLWLLRSSTSTFLSSSSSPMKELSLDCQVYGLAGEPIITSHTVAYNYIERQELSLVNILSAQIVSKFKHYHALLLYGLRFASAQYIILLISLFFNLSVRELFFNLQLSNPLVKELLLVLVLSDLSVRELFDNEKVHESKNNICVDSSNFCSSQKLFYIAAHNKFFQPSDSQFIYEESTEAIQSNLARFLSHINIVSHGFISSVNSLVKAFYRYKSFLSSKPLNNISIFNSFISYKIRVNIVYLYVYFTQLFSCRTRRVDPP